MSAIRLKRMIIVAVTISQAITGYGSFEERVHEVEAHPVEREDVSVTIAPPRRAPKLSATSVTSGMRAFRNACFIVTPLGEALRARRADVVRVDDLEHRGAHEARVGRDAGDHQHEHRQHQVVRAVDPEVDPGPGIDGVQVRDREDSCPVRSKICTTATWSISASQKTGVARPRKLNVVAM